MEEVLVNLIQRATNPKLSVPDTAAITETCSILERMPSCSIVAVKLIANKIQSSQELEALRGLMDMYVPYHHREQIPVAQVTSLRNHKSGNIGGIVMGFELLDSCMKHCGVSFHAEVGKFRFLNEMIKLVSPKYLGGRTPVTVRNRVLQLMYSWTLDYPQETKIREAYEMLRKQGVVKEDPMFSSQQPQQMELPLNPPPPRAKSSIFEDDERSRLLQKLLQSKNPEDLQAANRLIKTMVKEDERRVEHNSRCLTELESVHNNTRLLSEMLDSYRPGQTSDEELELIKELHHSCERLRPNVFRMASDAQDNEQLLNEVLSASDELGQVFDKYTAIIVKGQLPAVVNKNASLLDLSTPSEDKLPPVPAELLGKQLADLGLDLTDPEPVQSAELGTDPTVMTVQSDLQALGDIFGEIATPAKISPVVPVLQPVSILHPNSKSSTISTNVVEKPNKLKALEDLDVLGETLLKQSLPTSCKVGSQFTKSVIKVPMNLLGKPQDSGGQQDTSLIKTSDSVKSGLDFDFLVGDVPKLIGASPTELLNGDDSMVDITEDPPEEHVQSSNNNSALSERLSTNGNVHEKEVRSVSGNEDKHEVMPLNDIHVSLDSIKPGVIPPLTVLDEKNGISVVLHFAKDRPRPDVSVLVVTTLSKNQFPISNYQFQAVIPKTCKLKLQTPSGSDLPAHNPFLPPSAITQVMLIANPRKDPVFLKFMISYVMDDDLITERGEVDRLPLEL